MNRLGLKISCFVVSLVIWMQVASTADVQQTARLPLRVWGLASGLTTAGSEIPDHVSVRLTGSKLSLLTHKYFSRYIGEVHVNLADQRPGPVFFYQPGIRDVVTELNEPAIDPPVSFEVRVDTLVTRLVPVALAVKGALPDGTGFVTMPRVEPDSVAVTGPSRFFPDEFSVRTEPVDLSKHSSSDRVDVGLLPPHEHLVLAAKEVGAVIQVARMEERTLANVPVVPLVDAGRPAVGVSPPVADVMVRGVADSISRLTSDRLLVTVPVGDLPEGVYSMRGQVDYPAWMTLIGIVPREFQVIVGNPPLLSGPDVGDTEKENPDE
jgi:YbbR domain-containing protein